jgi:hypothetical protein
MSEYEIMKRQATIRTLVVSIIALYAMGCMITTTLSIALL